MTKLINERTNEIVVFGDGIVDLAKIGCKNVAEMIEAGWKDYKEPKGTALYWMILTLENFIENEPDDKWVDLDDCKQMLQKLKAWERLKNKGFVEVIKIRFRNSCIAKGKIVTFEMYSEEEQTLKDLDLLFGGEE